MHVKDQNKWLINTLLNTTEHSRSAGRPPITHCSHVFSPICTPLYYFLIYRMGGCKYRIYNSVLGRVVDFVFNTHQEIKFLQRLSTQSDPLFP